jgi:molecular chaperone DnaK (HSP70)
MTNIWPLFFLLKTDVFFFPFAIDRQIPTTLSYVDGDEYYGTQAKSFLVRNPTNTIAYFKDFLGQEYVIPQLRSKED